MVQKLRCQTSQQPHFAIEPIGLCASNSGLQASNENLTAALKKAGSAVTYTHMETDHGFTDHRIALETAILQWLHTNVK